ncbi:MAG: hypothetical protein M3367_05875 [Acidobacteriota bacterium]|nr:hypothetical protein [Acidobacteriota bacterium]
MKRLFLSLLFLLVLHLAAFQVLAQLQRLAIPPQSFSLTKKGASHDAKAYCLDRHLIISEPTEFRAVLTENINAVRVGSEAMTLRDAIAQNLVIVKGAGVRNRRIYSDIDGTQLKFISNTDKPITITFTQPVAMGEQNFSLVDPTLLKSVRKSQSLLDFKTVQDEIWRSGIDESRLEALGFYGSGVVVRNKATTTNAVLDFKSEQGLALTGTLLDTATKDALERAEQKEISALEQLGFRAIRSDTDVLSVSDNIRVFEEIFGLPSTGKLSKVRREMLKEYEPSLKQARYVSLSRLTPTELVAQNSTQNSTPNIITFLKSGSDLERTHILVGITKRIEFWTIIRGQLFGRQSGEAAIKALDQKSNTLAWLMSDKETSLVYASIYKPDGKVLMRIGRDEIVLSRSDMERFISGELSPPGIDAAIKKMFADKPARTKLLIFRSPFSQGQGGDAGNGESPLKQFGYEQHDSLELYLAFDRHYGKREKVDVFLVSDIIRGIKNLEGLPKLSEGSQIALYIDDAFKESAKTINPIRKDLEAAKHAQINVLKVEDDSAPQARISIFAGHRDEGYQQLILGMAEKGRFRDGIIVLAACGGGNCEAEFNSLLISKSGARAVIFYNQEIIGQAVQDVLLKFAELLSCECAPDGNYQELWKKSVDEVGEEAKKKESIIYQNEVKKLRNILIQVSSVGSKSSSPNAE